MEIIKDNKKVTNKAVFSLSDEYVGKIREAARYWGIKKSDVVRRAVDALWKDIQRERFGYKGSNAETKREVKRKALDEQAAAIERLEAMSLSEMHEYLLRIGYLKRPSVNGAGHLESEELRLGADGKPSVWYIVKYPGHDDWKSETNTLDWKELLRDLIKQKYL